MGEPPGGPSPDDERTARDAERLVKAGTGLRRGRLEHRIERAQAALEVAEPIEHEGTVAVADIVRGRIDAARSAMESEVTSGVVSDEQRLIDELELATAKLRELIAEHGDDPS